MEKNKIINKSLIVPFIIILILPYILWNTGIHGDDFVEIQNTIKVKTFNDFLYGSLRYIYGPINYLTFYWAYPVLGSENLLIYVLKK